MRRFFRQHWPLAFVAVVAWAIVVVRAIHQSVTWDEAATYLLFVWQGSPSVWYPDPNNHVLNTMLESLFVQIFGATPFTIRLPTLLGEIVYSAACIALCTRYVQGRVLQALTFACLVLNPFVMDYFVAARGYGLALAFLTSELYLLSIARDLPRYRLRAALGASVAAGLSISSNFSFGVAAVVALAVFGIVFALERTRARVRLGLALLFPAPLVALCICGPALTRFDSKRELVYGASSIGQMLGSVVSNTFDGPNAHIVNPNVLPLVDAFRDVAPVLVALLALCAFALLLRERTIARSPATPMLVILVITLVLEVGLASISHTLLPLNRTILFAAPLATLIVAFAIASVRLRVFTRAATIVVAAVALFFTLSVRSYFREWAFDSRIEPVYDALTICERDHPGFTVVTDVNFIFGLNFYQAVDSHPTVEPIVDQLSATGIDDERAIFVLAAGADDAFASRHGLKIVYSYPGQDSPDTQIAIKADIPTPVLPRPPFDRIGAP